MLFLRIRILCFDSPFAPKLLGRAFRPVRFDEDSSTPATAHESPQFMPAVNCQLLSTAGPSLGSKTVMLRSGAVTFAA